MSDPTTADAAIEVVDVSKRYKDLVALDRVSLTIGTGEFFGILGPNGAGKTTLVEIMEGLRKADTGSVRVFGESPWPRNLALLPRLGVQTQASAFFPRLAAREHVETVAALYGAGVEAARRSIERVGLTDKADAAVTSLSGGQRQRLAIAAALAHEPDLLFLDEPTAQLDVQARRNLWTLLRELKREGRTVVYTTHHLDEAEALCDRVAILDHGTVLAVDRPRELIRALDAPVMILVSQEQLTPEAARAISGVDGVDTDGDSLVLATRVPALVMPAVAKLTGDFNIQSRTAGLEEVYLKLTGTEYRA